MEVLERLRYINSADGPNIPLRTLGAYCGVSEATLSLYLTGKKKPRYQSLDKIEQGLKELAQEMMITAYGNATWIHN